MTKYSRKEKILKLIIEQFIQTATPVGSQTLINEYNLPYSSATIRNEMSELEQEGYIEKPHTSAGRVPSSKGYRFYIEHLRDTEIDEEVKSKMQELFSAKDIAINEIIKHGCEIIAQMTNLTSIVLGPDSSKETLSKIQYIPLNNNSAVAVFVTSKGHVESKTFNVPNGVSVDEIGTCVDIMNDRLVGTPINDIIDKMDSLKPILAERITQHEIIFRAFLEAFIKFTNERVAVFGRNNILEQPEFTSDINKLRKLVNLIENDEIWKKIVGEGDHLSIRIGKENQLMELDDVTLVSKPIRLSNNEYGTIALIGPTRMNYNKVISALEYLSEKIDTMLKEREGNED
ncbi:TPA: heat-inducible transcription repressor HrcA [bacterium]|jgi:heat-inducible transcriptional repressor|nr:heat-inducible transcription repressor HrcA [bacterium]